VAQLASLHNDTRQQACVQIAESAWNPWASRATITAVLSSMFVSAAAPTSICFAPATRTRRPSTRQYGLPAPPSAISKHDVGPPDDDAEPPLPHALAARTRSARRRERVDIKVC